MLYFTHSCVIWRFNFRYSSSRVGSGGVLDVSVGSMVVNSVI